ncbi:MAG: TolC family protein [Ignavibacteria bacterium]|nr:TolC family protein [Ignavibacteria bacterium]
MKILLLTQILSFLFSSGNDTLTLDRCYKITEETYPIIKQVPVYELIKKKRSENLEINYLPQISLKGQATYQSEVTKLKLSSPFIKPEEMSKDRYQVTLDVRQLIYDGGVTNIQKNLETNVNNIEKQKISVELYSLRNKINELYFSILILQKRKEYTLLLIKDIENRITELESKVRNGVIPASNILILEAQLMQLEQEINNIESDIVSSKNMLSELIGRNIDSSTIFILPETSLYDIELDTLINRPEYKLFDFQKKLSLQQDELISTKKLPKINIFGQAGIGRPGLNMLDNSFQPFYLVGLNIIWNPIDWNSANYEKHINKLNSDLIDIQKDVFNKSIRITLNKYKADISKYEKLIEKDDEIISKRGQIVKTTLSQLENGVITSTVYLTELINYNQALLTKEIHIILLTQSKINYLTTKGN